MIIRNKISHFVSTAILHILVLLCFYIIGSAQTTSVIRTLSLIANDIIYDPVTKRIYASVPSSAGSKGNSITVIDPEKGVIEASVFVGSEPNKLAISDDGKYLYVGLDGAAAVRRFNISTLTPEILFTLGSDGFFGPFYVEDMEVRPGCPNELAVSLMNQGVSPRHAGVAIYVDGVRRTNMTQRHTGSNVIEFGPSPGRLYGYNNETTEFGFRRISVNSDGLKELDVASNLVSGFGSDMKIDGGLIYSNSGRVLDPEAKTLLGTYTNIGGSSFASLVRPDSTVGRTFFLSSGSNGSSVKLLTYDQTTFTPIGSVDIPNVVGTPRSLVRWGKDGIAFRTSPDFF
jgi:hypothetical protein